MCIGSLKCLLTLSYFFFHDNNYRFHVMLHKLRFLHAQLQTIYFDKPNQKMSQSALNLHNLKTRAYQDFKSGRIWVGDIKRYKTLHIYSTINTCLTLKRY